MSTVGTVGIVGLGLIGGSLARDLATSGIRVLGADSDPSTLRAALEAGVIRKALDPAAPEEVDVLVLAVPVDRAPDLIRRLAARIPPASGLVVTDVGSTKRSVVRAAVESGIGHRFVGGHPMAGDHRCGWYASRRGLFREATVWLCAPPSGGDAAVARVAELWRAVGGRPRPIEAAEHDRRLAAASHLPQAAATALAGVLARGAVPVEELGPGGRDATRLAASDPSLWTAILLENADELAPAMSDLIEELRALAAIIARGDTEALGRRLERARAWRDTDRAGGPPQAGA